MLRAESRRNSCKSTGIPLAAVAARMSAVAHRGLELVPVGRAPRTNVRPALTALVGRADVLERLSREIRGGHRLFTIVGPPGMGKTRVARAALETLGEAYAGRGGAWFCDLADCRSEAELVHAMLSVVSERTAEHVREAAAKLERILCEAGPMLLVLDNFEQIASAAPVVQRLVAVARELIVLVTSRERLALDGERVLELAPLACPDETDPGRGSDAVTLFLARARAVGGTVGDDLSAIAEIVRRLDGIPLAIELAASRTRLLSPRDLAQRLARGHELLGGGTRNAEARHATLTSAIAWSWNLLSEEERLALARLSVFAGGFTLAFAEAVLGDGALDRVGSLRDKSLAFARAPGRLSLYVSIREFAARKLEALGHEAVVEARTLHARAFAEASRLFAESRTLPDRASRAFAYADLRGERENLVAALEHIKTLPGSREVARMRASLASALSLLLALPAEACRAELDAALVLLSEHPCPVTRAHLLFARQSVSRSMGDDAQCLDDLAEMRASTELPRELRTLARIYEGIMRRSLGLAEEAWRCHVDAANELSRVDHVRLSAMNDACMGRLRGDFRDAEGARELNGRALATCEATGDAWLGALPLANLAQLEQELGAMDRARALLEQALDRFRSEGESHYEAIYAGALGDLCFETGELERAREWYAYGARFLGQYRTPGVLHAAAAAVEATAGNFARAELHLAAARAGADRIGSPVVRLVLELHRANVDVCRGADEHLVARLRRRLAELSAEGDDARVHRGSLDVRFAARMLGRALDRARPPRRASTLGLERATRTFVSPEGERISLERRGSLWKLLLALVERHERGEHDGLSVLAAFEVGWPGDRVLLDAAQTRVRVAIATLRKLGLRSVLVTRDDGYLLEPALCIARLDG